MLEVKALMSSNGNSVYIKEGFIYDATVAVDGYYRVFTKNGSDIGIWDKRFFEAIEVKKTIKEVW